MAVYPAQLTTEEKNLKKRYSRLQEKVRRLCSSRFTSSYVVSLELVRSFSEKTAKEA